MTARPILFSAPMVRAMLAGKKTKTRRAVKITHRTPGLAAALEPAHGIAPYPRAAAELCPYGAAGDLLWVRESSTYWESPSPTRESITPRANESNRPADGKRYERWMSRVMAQEEAGADFLVYKADDSKRSLAEWAHPHPIYEHCVGRFGKTIPAIHMHRWASRLTLRINDVGVERLQDISEADAIAEGICYLGKNVNGFDMWAQYGAIAETKAGLCADVQFIGRTAQEAFRKLWESINGKASWDANPWTWAISYDPLKQNVDTIIKAAA